MCTLCDIKLYTIIDIKPFNCVDNSKGGISGAPPLDSVVLCLNRSLVNYASWECDAWEKNAG